MPLAEDAINRIGPLLEQLGARFELVLEAVTGFGGRVDALRTELTGQFTEVGRQIRFISDRIADNRDAVAVTRADLGAEMVRVGEMLGATRIEFREQLASIRHELTQNAENTATHLRDRLADDLVRGSAAVNAQLKEQIAAAGDALRKELAIARGELGRELPAITQGVRDEISTSSDHLVKKIDAELKNTGKALATLTRKFERFDDRLTVQTRDQDQRLRKLERRAVNK